MNLYKKFYKINNNINSEGGLVLVWIRIWSVGNVDVSEIY